MEKHGKHRSLVGRVAALACAAIVIAAPVHACRLALALALDVSGSVDEREYALQTRGLAEALADTTVQRALLVSPGFPVALAIYEWSSSSHQRLVLNWTLVRSTEDIEAIRARLLSWERIPAPEATGLGAALVFGKALLADAPDCFDHTLDVSGDGKNNDWPLPDRLKDEGHLDGLRINALVVATEMTVSRWSENSTAELAAYFRSRIIQGPGSFIEVALGYEDYARAMRRKLLRELSTLPLGGVPAPIVRRAALSDDQ